MTDCCGQPSFCEKPCFHDCGRSTPGRAGAIASMNPHDQVGGSHYMLAVIPPIDFIVANSIPFREANIIKYVFRYGKKNGKEDLLKARHYLDMLIAEYERDGK